LAILNIECVPVKYKPIPGELQFKTVGLIPIVEGKINGKRAWFIIDTGASVSILNRSNARHFGFKCFDSYSVSVVGFGGESKMNEAFNCKVEFGPLLLKNISFRARHMNDLTDVIRQHENIEIAGIIGADVFNRYKIAIDFKKSTISF
jgi:hypothetical protein